MSFGAQFALSQRSIRAINRPFGGQVSQEEEEEGEEKKSQSLSLDLSLLGLILDEATKARMSIECDRSYFAPVYK